MDKLARQNPDICETLQRYIDEGKSYQLISETLSCLYPSTRRGLSARSVRRFCAANGISKRKGNQLDGIVAQGVSEVYRSTCISVIRFSVLVDVEVPANFNGLAFVYGRG